jgi:hypothetical protein
MVDVVNPKPKTSIGEGLFMALSHEVEWFITISAKRVSHDEDHWLIYSH